MKYIGQNFASACYPLQVSLFFWIPLLYIKANASVKYELNFYLQAAI